MQDEGGKEGKSTTCEPAVEGRFDSQATHVLLTASELVNLDIVASASGVESSQRTDGPSPNNHGLLLLVSHEDVDIMLETNVVESTREVV